MRILFISVVFLGIVLQSCQAQPSAVTVDAKTFHKELSQAKEKVILDVRTPEEFAAGYIDQATLMNYYDPGFNSAMKKLDRNKTYFVYCAAGGRSHSVLEDMKKEGFKHIVELEGGISAWKSNNLPLVKPK